MADSPTLGRRILLLGAGGMIGSALSRACSGAQLEEFQHQELDITDYLEVEKVFLKHKPEFVLNAAAFTRVDDCEKFRETAFVVNAQAPGHLAALCKKYSSLLVHFSTDYIFDGTFNAPYPENYPQNPINYYGVTKLEGEKQIIAGGCSYLIIRTSWIFGRNGDNFVKKLLKRALAGAKLQAPIDQTGVPTYAGDVAAAVLKLLSLQNTGIYHFSNSGECSRHEQAQTILKLYGLNNSVEPVKNDSLPTAAKRPIYSVLDCSKYIRETGSTPRSWQQSTAEYIAYLKANEHELRS
ncbi:MAG TPA: dTDP-4-dehydrorhamnose reductase [Acidobacteriota bacterium]|nr:dTDP-4-dehydrorhamnose reductase [Acidobacteriota bacterium]